MAGLLWLFAVSLSIVLLTPDSVSHDRAVGNSHKLTNAPSAYGRLYNWHTPFDHGASVRLFYDNPRSVELSFSSPMHEASAALPRDSFCQETPVIRAVNDTPIIPQNPVDDSQPRSAFATTFRAALVPVDGRQLVERLRRRRSTLYVLRDMSPHTDLGAVQNNFAVSGLKWHVAFETEAILKSGWLTYS